MLCPECEGGMVQVKDCRVCLDCGAVFEKVSTDVRDARRLADGFALLTADEDPDVETDNHIGR